MNHYIEHAPDGRILQAIKCSEAPSALLGGVVIPVPDEVDPTRCVVVDGAVIDLGPPPSPSHVVDYEAHAWVPGPVSELQLAQRAKWLAIKDERDAREAGGFPHAGKLFDSDPLSVQRISGAAQAAQLALSASAPFSITWVCQDNSTVDLDAAGMVAVMVSLVAYAGSLHATARTLRDEIFDSAATLASVAAVAWPA